MEQYSLTSVQKIYDALVKAEAPKVDTQTALKKFKPAINAALKKGLNYSQITSIINRNLSSSEKKFTENQLSDFLNHASKKETTKTSINK